MLIHRQKELDSLRQAYQSLMETNRMQVRFITGEAGSGKSVLANQFIDETARQAEQTLFVSTYCNIRSEYSIPYQPFKELLKQLLQDVGERDKCQRTRAEQVKDSFAFCGRMLLEHAPDLLGNFIPGAQVLSAIGQSLFKEQSTAPASTFVEESKILEQYLDTLRAIAARYRLVLFIDDLQWIDPASVNLLYHLVMGLQNAPVMFLGCYRSTDIDITVQGERHPLTKFITQTKILRGNVFTNLDALSTDERKLLMNAMLDAEPNQYDALFREKLFERTGGNPLFVNELMELLKEEGMVVHNYEGVQMNNASLQWRSYPARIEGIIQERIGRLEDSLVEILSHASVQGYNFIAQVLSRTMGEPERDLLMKLSKTLQKQHHLVTEGSCIRSEGGMVSQFNFSNYIFQQYLYQELSMTQRMMLHSDIAGILEELFHNEPEEVSGDIARHFEMSGEYEKALRYILITVDSMMRISRYTEANTLINKGLSLLDGIRDPLERKRTQLSLLLKQCICYRSLKGWGSAEVEELYLRTRDLCEELGQREDTEVTSFGIWGIYLSKLNLRKCIEVARENKIVGQQLCHRSMILTATISIGNTLFWMGRLGEAQAEFDEYMREAEKDKQAGAARTENDEMNDLFARMFTLLIAQRTGDRLRAQEMQQVIRQTIETGRNHFFNVIAYQALSWFYYFEGNQELLNSYSRKLLRESTEYGFAFYEGIGKMFRGSCLQQEEGSRPAIDLIEEGYAILKSQSGTDPTGMHSIYATLISRCLLKAGEDERFLTLIEQVIRTSEAHEECCYLDELYLTKADFFLRKGDTTNRKLCLQKALEAARANQAAGSEKHILSLIQ